MSHPADKARLLEVVSRYVRSHNWDLEANLFGDGATLRDVADQFGLTLDQVKKRSARERWAESP